MLGLCGMFIAAKHGSMGRLLCEMSKAADTLFINAYE